MTGYGVVRVAVAEEVLPCQVVVSKEVAGRSRAREDDGAWAVRFNDLVVNQVSLPSENIRVDRDDRLCVRDLGPLPEFRRRSGVGDPDGTSPREDDSEVGSDRLRCHGQVERNPRTLVEIEGVESIRDARGEAVEIAVRHAANRLRPFAAR